MNDKQVLLLSFHVALIMSYFVKLIYAKIKGEDNVIARRTTFYAVFFWMLTILP